jgi:hypothetical protein
MTKKQKYRVGPAQELRQDDHDPYPFPSDPLEWLVVTVVLSAIGVGAYVMHYLSDMS